MDYTVLKTENGHPIYVKSMSKLHRITHFCFNRQGENRLYKGQDKIAVASLPGFPNVELMADVFGGERKFSLSNLSTQSELYTNLYMYCSGHFFQIAGVFDTREDANACMSERPDTAIMDSTQIHRDLPTFHFIAAREKAKLLSK